MQLTRAQLTHVVAGHVTGATVAELAAEFGVHRQTIANHLHRRGFSTVTVS